MLTKAHHIAIISSDYDRAKEFYVEKLGFELYKEVYRPNVPDHLWMLRKGDVVLLLKKHITPPGRNWGTDSGPYGG